MSDYEWMVQEIARLAQMNLAPQAYCHEFLLRVLAMGSASAGSMWRLTPQSQPELVYEMNTHEIKSAGSTILVESHWKILKKLIVTGRPLHFPPFGDEQSGLPANKCDCHLLVVPILIEKKVNGMIEVWKAPSHESVAPIPSYMQFLMAMARLASAYPGFGAHEQA
jgi:hypothetical protein